MSDMTITIIVLVFALLVFAFCCLYEQQANVLRKNSYIIARQQREIKQLHAKNEQLQKTKEWYKAENEMLRREKNGNELGTKQQMH